MMKAEEGRLNGGECQSLAAGMLYSVDMSPTNSGKTRLTRRRAVLRFAAGSAVKFALAAGVSFLLSYVMLSFLAPPRYMPAVSWLTFGPAVQACAIIAIVCARKRQFSAAWGIIAGTTVVALLFPEFGF